MKDKTNFNLKIVISLFIVIVVASIFILNKFSNNDISPSEIESVEIEPLEMTAVIQDLDAETIENIDLSQYRIKKEDFVKEASYKNLIVTIKGKLNEDVSIQYTTDFLIATKEDDMCFIVESKGISIDEMKIFSYSKEIQLRPTGHIYINVNDQGKIVKSDQIHVTGRIVYTYDEVTDYEYFIDGKTDIEK